jgi:hypothetical protein
MQRDGEYTVWFRTPRGQGTGIVYLSDGKISGGDCFFDYAGSYQLEDDQFTATLTTRRRAEGPTTVFGVDEIEVKLTGSVREKTVWCCGTAEQAPGLRFEATLFPGIDQASPPAVKRPAATFSSARLVKIPGDVHRPRNRFSQPH